MIFARECGTFFALESGFIDRAALGHRLFSSSVVSLLNVLKTKCLSSKHGLIDSYDALTLAHSSSMSIMSKSKYEQVTLLEIRMCCSFWRAWEDKHAGHNGVNDVGGCRGR